VGRKFAGDAIKVKVWWPLADAIIKLFIQYSVVTRADRFSKFPQFGPGQ